MYCDICGRVFKSCDELAVHHSAVHTATNGVDNEDGGSAEKSVADTDAQRMCGTVERDRRKVSVIKGGYL